MKKFGIYDSESRRWLYSKPRWYRRTLLRLKWVEQQRYPFYNLADAIRAVEILRGISGLEIASSPETTGGRK